MPRSGRLWNEVNPGRSQSSVNHFLPCLWCPSSMITPLRGLQCLIWECFHPRFLLWLSLARKARFFMNPLDCWFLKTQSDPQRTQGQSSPYSLPLLLGPNSALTCLPWAPTRHSAMCNSNFEDKEICSGRDLLNVTDIHKWQSQDPNLDLLFQVHCCFHYIMLPPRKIS